MVLDEVMKKYGIGLTGGICCGKSTVSKILRNIGFPVIDADDLAREAVEPNSKGLALVVGAFGGNVLLKTGALNRAMMRDIIFTNPKKKDLLESILHPVIQELLAKRLVDLGLFQHPRYWFYEASLLYETGRDKNFREIWAVLCPPQVQISRLIKRDKCDEKMARKILEAQMPAKLKASRANVVIDTNSPMEEMEAKVRLALETLPKKL